MLQNKLIYTYFSKYRLKSDFHMNKMPETSKQCPNKLKNVHIEAKIEFETQTKTKISEISL